MEGYINEISYIAADECFILYNFVPDKYYDIAALSHVS